MGLYLVAILFRQDANQLAAHANAIPGERSLKSACERDVLPAAEEGFEMGEHVD